MSEIRGLQISYNKTSKMPNSDAQGVFGHDRFIIGHDNKKCHPLSEERARLGVYELVIIKH